ncbi:MFS transporter [Parasediminibacterium sp. JCM 36343]|uniref:MFS transporter n=1 Tax=Parasediminibacterium sp. JCM 36343 TaxID=3374279 RepID=UPI00397C2D46
MITTVSSSPPSTPKQIRIAVAAFFFVSGFGFASFASRIPTLQQKLHLNDAELGTALFATPLGLICTLPLTGFLLSRYSSRYVLLLGSISYNILLFLLGLVNNSWQLGIVLFLFGSARNLMNISVNAQSVGVQGLYSRSIITTFHGIWSVSGFAGAALGGWMIGKDIVPATHFAIVGLLCLAVMGGFFKHTVRHDARKVEGQKPPLFYFPDKALLKLSLIAFGCMACEGIMFDWSGIYFQKVVHAPKYLITTGYVAFMCAAAVGRFSGDWMVNNIGIKKVLQICSAFIGVGLSIAIFFPYLVTVTIGFVGVGLGISCIVPLIMALAGRTSGKSAGISIASVSTVSYFGFLLGPPIIGYIAEAANLQWSFSIGVLAAVGMFGLVSRVVR